MAAFCNSQQATDCNRKKTQVELSISCRNLNNLLKPDSQCVLRISNTPGSYEEYDRTEVCENTENPEYMHKFIVDYYFEQSQQLQFEIYNTNDDGQPLEFKTPIGTLTSSFGKILSCNGGRKEAKLDDHPFHQLPGLVVFLLKVIWIPEELYIFKDSNLFETKTTEKEVKLQAEEVKTDEVCVLQFSAENLNKKDLMGKPNPYLVFYKQNKEDSYTRVHQTEAVKNSLNPQWEPFEIKIQSLCSGDYDRTIKVECYDSKNKKNNLIGEFNTSLRCISKGPGASNVYSLTNAKKHSKKKDRNSKTVSLRQYQMKQKYSFLDYIKSGTDMEFVVAIDFTASNENPQDPSSLHYLGNNNINYYAAAIQAVGEIIHDYDSDNLFPSFGFGAMMPDGDTPAYFPLNFDHENPYCEGVQGILKEYYKCLNKIELYGPSELAPLVKLASRIATKSDKPDGSFYVVLLILTDGDVVDIPETIEEIIIASELPVSIIIVGIGNNNFRDMERLDADESNLINDGHAASRDIVQFVRFSDFCKKQGNIMEIKKSDLTKSVLEEIPGQLVSYMSSHILTPAK